MCLTPSGGGRGIGATYVAHGDHVSPSHPRYRIESRPLPPSVAARETRAEDVTYVLPSDTKLAPVRLRRVAGPKVSTHNCQSTLKGLHAPRESCVRTRQYEHPSASGVGVHDGTEDTTSPLDWSIDPNAASPSTSTRKAAWASPASGSWKLHASTGAFARVHAASAGETRSGADTSLGA